MALPEMEVLVKVSFRFLLFGLVGIASPCFPFRRGTKEMGAPDAPLGREGRGGHGGNWH